MEKFVFNIDVLGAGACTLRCPCCPVGNMPKMHNRKGLMSTDLLQRILDKAVSECEVEAVMLFNWTEPLLHPELPELIRIVRNHGLRCDLSSNLNEMPRIDEVLRAEPTNLRISMSGFHQETYDKTHRGGDV